MSQNEDTKLVEVEVRINELDFLRLNPAPGEVLLFVLKSEEADQNTLNGFGAGLRSIFPNNKVAVIGLGVDDKVELTTVKASDILPEVKDCSQPTSYCDNCSCGKKERVENDNKN